MEISFKKDYIGYFFYIVRHKFWILYYGLKYGNVPIWNLIVHDWDKLLPEWWGQYPRMGYILGTDKDFDELWLKHVYCQPHHWQYWHKNQIPDKYLFEMIYDWMSANKSRGGNGFEDTRKWFILNLYSRLFLIRELKSSDVDKIYQFLKTN